jgi:hypothetical protein
MDCIRDVSSGLKSCGSRTDMMGVLIVQPCINFIKLFLSSTLMLFKNISLGQAFSPH